MIPRPKSSMKAHHLSSKERQSYAQQDPYEGPIMLVRRLDWQEKLSRFLDESRREGVKCDWEFNHCASWCALGVLEETGYDFYEPWREYTIESPGDAYLALKRMGFDSLEQCIESQFVEVPLAFAQRGDLALVPTPEYTDLGMPQALGIVWSPLVYVLRPEGLGHVKLFDCHRAFSVGSLG